MKTELKIGDQKFKIEIGQLSENFLKISVNEKDFYFLISYEGLKLVDKKEIDEKILKGCPSEKSVLKETKTNETIKEIKSPLIGTVSEIFVKNGDYVKINDRLITIISMKMENEILSPCETKIKEVRVKKGQLVQKDDVLILLE